MKLKCNYEDEAAKLAKAADIAIEAFQKYPDKRWEQKHIDHFITCYTEWRNKVLNPLPQYKKLNSLKYVEQDIFTIFKEGAGEFVEYFWHRMAEEKLTYVRENKARKILERGSIKGHVEYNYVIDMLVPAQQSGFITKDEAKQLSEMLGRFEAKFSKKNKK